MSKRKQHISIEQLEQLQKEGKIRGFERPKEARQPTIPFAEKEHRKQRKTERTYHEFELQRDYVAWLDETYPWLKEKRLRFHVANQGWKGGHAAGKVLKAMGKLAGVPDFFILVKRCGCSGLLLDFKAPGETLSDEQQEFFESATAEGFLCEAVETLDQARFITTSYLDEKLL